MLRTEISEERLSAIMSAAYYDIRNPRTVTKKMLFERVQRAARIIGIEAPLQLQCLIETPLLLILLMEL